jgi:hypothetical protein
LQLFFLAAVPKLFSFCKCRRQARLVQTAGFKSEEVAAIVEIGVEHGAVMFTAGNEGDGLARKRK